MVNSSSKEVLKKLSALLPFLGLQSTKTWNFYVWYKIIIGLSDYVLHNEYSNSHSAISVFKNPKSIFKALDWLNDELLNLLYLSYDYRNEVNGDIINIIQVWIKAFTYSIKLSRNELNNIFSKYTLISKKSWIFWNGMDLLLKHYIRSRNITLIQCFQLESLRFNFNISSRFTSLQDFLSANCIDFNWSEYNKDNMLSANMNIIPKRPYIPYYQRNALKNKQNNYNIKKIAVKNEFNKQSSYKNDNNKQVVVKKDNFFFDNCKKGCGEYNIVLKDNFCIANFFGKNGCNWKKCKRLNYCLIENCESKDCTAFTCPNFRALEDVVEKFKKHKVFI